MAAVLVAAFAVPGCSRAGDGRLGEDAAGGTPTAREPSAAESDEQLDPLATAALGRSGCAPPSPVYPSHIGPFLETRLTSNGIEGWALLYDRPPWDVGVEVKTVWRVSGVGPLDAVALSPTGEQLPPTWGPAAHAGSNYERPGAEWGVGFTLDSPGCWELRGTQAEGTASIWLEVQGGQ